MKNKIWIVGFTLAIGSLFLLLSLNRIMPNANGGLALISSDYDGGWIKGSESAKAILVEYSDFQCPACRLYEPMLKQLEQDFGNELKIIYRHFPLAQIHKNALGAALASEAAGLQGKFWEMHDLLFANQDAWKDLTDAKRLFKSYAKTIGLDIPKFSADMESSAVLNSVKESYSSGVKLGLQGTPSFFLSGSKIDNPYNYDQFKNLIQQAVDL